MTEVTHDTGDRLGPVTHASSSIHGDAMMLQLQQGWKPLPLATLFALALGGLRVRLMRSVVTMLSIVLAIAFLTYTGLTNQLTYKLAVQLQSLEAERLLPPEEVRNTVRAMLAIDPLSGLSQSEQIKLARVMGMADVSVLQSQRVTLPQIIRGAEEKAADADAKYKLIAADTTALAVDVEAARVALEAATRQLTESREKLVAIEAQTDLAAWIEANGTGDAKGRPERLAGQLDARYRQLVGTMTNPGRLSAEDVRLIEEHLLVLPAVQKAPEIAGFRKIIEIDRIKRAGVELRMLLRGAAVNVQLAIAGNPMDTWLIVMAMMTCAVGIANAMLMSVTERFREIGTMKCLGAQDNLVVKLFLLESGVLGIIGALIGIVLGIAVALLAAVLQFKGHGVDNFPFSDGIVVILLSIVGGVMLSIAGAVYPAYSASRMRPVDALRVDE